MVIALGGLAPEQGFDVLKDVSQRTNTRLRTVADLVIGWVTGAPLPDDVRRALGSALERARSGT